MHFIEKILPYLATLFGGGWLVQFIYFRLERRKKKAETKDVEIDVDEKEDKLRDKKLSDAYDTIVKLQDIVNTERDRWIKLAEEVSFLKQELVEEKEARQLAEKNKCTVSGCIKRQPPRR